MVPYDDSKPASDALEIATDLAKKYSSKISVITYVPINFEYSGDGVVYVETTRLLKKSAAYALSKLEPKLQRLGLAYDLKVIDGVSIVEALLSYAQMHKVDLIVMGSRGLGGFKKLMLGSVASGISQHSKCPVLITK